MVKIRNWSELPDELLTMVAEKLELIEDFTRFGSVCQSWRSATLDKHHFASFLKPSLPWLMLATDDYDNTNNHEFFVPWENKIRHINLPEIAGTRYWGSPFGWLVTFGYDQEIHLFNILSRDYIELPSISTFIFSKSDKIPQRNILNYVSKAFVVSMSPKNLVGDFLVFVVIGESCRLAFARPGDTTWTVVKNAGYVHDIIYLNGLVYLLTGGRLNHVRVSKGDIRVCDISCSEPTARHFSDLPRGDWSIYQSYMFELCGELHIAVRHLCSKRVPGRPSRHHEFYTHAFRLYKLNSSTCKWDRSVPLGDYALFLGSSSSFCVKASGSDFPACMPECVYYTDNNDAAGGCLRGGDMGVYSFMTNEVEPLYDGDGSVSRFSPPLWLTPNLFSSDLSLESSMEVDGSELCSSSDSD